MAAVDVEEQPQRRQGKARQRRSRMRVGGRTARSGARRTSAGARARLRYRFDNALARGPLVVIVYLAALSLLAVVLVALVATALRLSFGGGRDDSLAEGMWQAMLRTLDAGTFSADADWPTRVLGLLITVLGIFLAGSLIGLIANAVDRRVEELRLGRNRVVEAGHTLILGWSPKVPRIVAELVAANASERSAAVVLLARADAAAMEATIRQCTGDMRTTALVCRTGDPSVPTDLERVAVADARSIIVVRGDEGDAGVVKAVLAVRATDPDHAWANVVAELSEPDHARTLRTVSGGRVLAVSSDDIVADVTAQACLRDGLASVITELLDFGGSELYFTAMPPELDGRTYRDALLAFDRCSVVGVAGASTVELNPELDRALGAHEELVVVAEDDATIAFTGIRPLLPAAAGPPADADQPPLRLVVVGWSGFGSLVLRELDGFLPPGSSIDLVVDQDLVDRRTVEALSLTNASVRVRAGSGGADQLFSLCLDDPPDQAIVLGYRDALGVDDADARTLLALLTLREIWPIGRPDHVRIVVELLDQTNQVLAAPVGIDDLIVSDALASLVMAQLSERADLQTLLEDLFDADGAVVDLVPVAALGLEGSQPVEAIVAAAAHRGMSAFGYREAATRRVVVNPPKSAVVALAPGDEVIVLAHRS